MAIYDNDGITSREITKLYDNNGSTSTQIGKIYDWDGVSSKLIYSSEVTLTNILPTPHKIEWTWYDWGYDSQSSSGPLLPMDTSKRYYVRFRAYVSQYNVDGGQDYYSYINGGLSRIYSREAYHSLDSAWHSIVNGVANGTQLAAAMRRQYTCGTCGVDQGMVVDITDLESVVGRTLTANEVWAMMGSAYFSGSITLKV